MTLLALIRTAAPARSEAKELDAPVLERARRADDAACRVLVETYQSRVFAIVRRTLGGSRAGRVEDVCQECFLRVFSSLSKFDPAGPAKLSTWIITIATRLCFDEMRRGRARKDGFHDDIDDKLAAPAISERVADENALRRRVERALDTLPADLRATFVLRVTAELSVEETARVLDIDEGTVKSRLSRARDRLRTELGDAR